MLPQSHRHISNYSAVKPTTYLILSNSRISLKAIFKMPNKLVLYNFDMSPPVRTVKVVAKVLGLELEIRDVDLLNKKHLDEEFLKINPEHTVPTLDDNGVILWDSHSICGYLVDKYGKDDSLYPKDLALRARINQRLIFDASSLFVRLRDASKFVFWQGGKEIPKHCIDAVYEAYDILEKFVATDLFLVGDQLTIADICAGNTVGLLKGLAPFNDKYPNIEAWIARIKKTIPVFAELNDPFNEMFGKMIKGKLEQNNAA